jgi:hypothetical protein
MSKGHNLHILLEERSGEVRGSRRERGLFRSHHAALVLALLPCRSPHASEPRRVIPMYHASTEALKDDYAGFIR